MKVPRQRPDADAVPRLLDEGQVWNAIDVDEDGRLQQPEIEHGNEALPAGNDLGIVAGFRQRPDRRVNAVGDHVVERCRLHNRETTRTVFTPNDFHN